MNIKFTKEERDNMKELIKESISLNDFKRYLNDFPSQIDYNIYQYGNLDVYNWDIYRRFKDLNSNYKAVRDYEKFIDSNKDVENETDNLIKLYKNLVRVASLELIEEINLGVLTEKNFLQ